MLYTACGVFYVVGVPWSTCKNVNVGRRTVCCIAVSEFLLAFCCIAKQDSAKEDQNKALRIDYFCVQIHGDNLDALNASPPLHQRFPNVKEIAIEDDAVDDSQFASFVMSDACHMSRLVKIDLSVASSLDLPSVLVLAHCTGLQELYLPQNLSVPGFALFALQRLPSLRVLSGRMACDEPCCVALGSLTQLTSLLWKVASSSGDASPFVLPRGLDALNELQLTVGKGFDLNALHGLTRLHVECTSRDNGDAIDRVTLRAADMQVLARLRNLKSMTVPRIDLHDALRHELATLASLTELQVQHEVVDMSAVLSCFPSLVRFEYAQACDADFHVISQVATQLRDLRITHGGDTSVGLLHSSKLTNLTALHLSRFGNLRDQDVFALVATKRMQMLCNLSLWHCKLLTDDAFSSIAALPHVASLTVVSRCKGITVLGLATLIMHAPHLRNLNVRFCWGVTGDDIELCRQRARALCKIIHIA